jgi:hypothetical protein
VRAERRARPRQLEGGCKRWRRLGVAEAATPVALVARWRAGARGLRKAASCPNSGVRSRTSAGSCRAKLRAIWLAIEASRI